MSMFTLLNLAKALRLIQESLFSEAVTLAADNNHEPTRIFYAQQINMIFGSTDAEERITKHRELKEMLEEGAN